MIERRTRRPLLRLVEARAVEAHRADDLLGQREAEVRVGRDREVDVDGRAGRDVLELGGGRPEHERRRLERPVRAVGDGAGDLAVRQLERRLDDGARGAALGPHGPQRAEPDLEVADARRRALEHVEAGAGAAAEHVAVHRRGEQRVAVDAQLERRARRAEDAEVRLGRRLVGARRAADDRDLVDDDVRAAQQRADAERADREHADQRPGR